MHHSDIRGRLRAPFLKRMYYNGTLRRSLYLRISQADAFVVLSESFKQDFYDFLPGVRKEKITAIPNMNSFENGSIPSGKAREVLFVGRLDNPVKGVDRLLKIWSMVCPGGNAAAPAISLGSHGPSGRILPQSRNPVHDVHL